MAGDKMIPAKLMKVLSEVGGSEKPGWELVTLEGYEHTWRLEVPGGWLYRHAYEMGDGRWGEVMAFVPEPEFPQ